ncbi:hypothetical protein A2U01_0040563, partial [Trifolium medium]|nr:hypothetical protein [Trifolium medium]
MVGPKSMRLVGVINGGSIPTRRRRATGSGGQGSDSSSRSSSNQEESNDGSGGELQHEPEETEEPSLESRDARRSSPGIELTVVLPSANINSGQSGVRVLMEEQVLQETEPPIVTREDPACKAREVEKLIEIQQDLGVSFDLNQQSPVDILLKMEDRDRRDLAK